jgi:hypothetical protein
MASTAEGQRTQAAYASTTKTGEPFALSDIWEGWRHPETGELLRTQYLHRGSAGRDGGSTSTTFCAGCLTCEHFHLGAVYSQSLPRDYSIRMRLFCSSDVHSIRWRNIVLTFVWHSLSCIAHLSGWETVEMFVRAIHIRAPLSTGPPPRRHRMHPDASEQPAGGRVRVHSTYHGSGRLASHSTLATAPRRLRLRPDAQ